MIMKGQKRKHPPEEVDVSDRSSPMWESQRQFVFSVSLNKYHHSQELPEPSLRRSVLIANTLRQVSLEAFAAPSVDMEASPPPCSSSSGLLESVFTAKHHPAETFSNSHSALNLKCLPSLSSFGPLSSSSSSPTCLSSPPFSSQNHGLDLEHLMEILVES